MQQQNNLTQQNQQMPQGQMPPQGSGQAQPQMNAQQQQMMLQQQMLNNPALLAQMGAFNMAQFGVPSTQTGEKRTYDNSTCLYVGNLTQTTFDNDLFKHFTSKGYKLKNAKVMLDYTTKRSKCFGYLNFFDQSEAQRCFETENNTVLDGRQLVINLKKSGEFDQAANVLVKNLPKEMAQ